MLTLSTSGSTIATVSRDTYHHGDLRAALIESALEVIREAGAGGLKLREVARRAGVSHAAPYRHFRDKEDLTAAIAEDGFLLLGAEMRKARELEATPRQRLVHAGRAYVALALRRPDHFRVMFATDLDAKRHPAARKAADEAFAGLLALLTECQQSGAIAAGDTLTLARITWAQVHGVAMLAIGRQFQIRTQAEVLVFAVEAMEALLTGLERAR